jgi:hypothetical protein
MALSPPVTAWPESPAGLRTRSNHATFEAGTLVGLIREAKGTTVLSIPRYSAYPVSALSPQVDRPTTEREEIIGTIRGWTLLNENWDGEGASAPSAASLKDAVLFVNLLNSQSPLPQPMLHASGKAGLYWNQGGLYADIEFLGDGRVTYYVEQHGKDKHKGVVQIRQNEMPAVFGALIRV